MAARDIDTTRPANDAADGLKDQAHGGNVYAEASTTLDTIIADPFLMQRPIGDTMFGEKAGNNRQDAQHAANATMTAAATMSASERFDNFEMTINGDKFDGQDLAEKAQMAKTNPEYVLNQLVEGGMSHDRAEDRRDWLAEHADEWKAGKIDREDVEQAREAKEAFRILDGINKERENTPEPSDKPSIERENGQLDIARNSPQTAPSGQALMMWSYSYASSMGSRARAVLPPYSVN